MLIGGCAGRDSPRGNDRASCPLTEVRTRFRNVLRFGVVGLVVVKILESEQQERERGRDNVYYFRCL